MHPAPRPATVTRLLGGVAPVLLLALALGGATGACSAGDGSAGAPVQGAATSPVAPTGTDPAPMPTHVPASGASATPSHVAADPMVPPASAVAAAWALRPAYVTASTAETQAAYAYALARPDVLRWLPCYCGCGGMGHRSNLDCFVKPRDEAGDPLLFEEHASYCDVCVKTALMADRMVREGRTLLEIRAAVDSTFGGLAPGTPTELPPAG